MIKKRIITALLILTMLFTMVPATGTRVEAVKKKVVKVKKVTLNKKSMTLQVGSSMRLKVTLSPKRTTQKTLIWSTSNKKIAKVSQKGTVKAVKKGAATITVKVKGTKKKTTCKITVKPIPKCSSKYRGKDKIKHKEIITSNKSATCSTNGYIKYKCTRCGDVRTKTIKKNNNHSFKLFLQNRATCEEDGYIKKKCQNCKMTEKIVTDKALKHNYISFKTIKKPTCNSTGLEQCICNRCGKIKNENIQKLNHNYEIINTTPSTCTKKGSITKKCKNCGDVNTTESDYTHAYQEVIEKQPTCKTEGSRISKCKDCGKISYRETIKKLSHNTSPVEESETYTISECKVCKDRILDYHDKEFTIKFKDGTTKTVVGHYEPHMEQEMFRLLNEYRVKNGLKALKLGDNDLREKARIRARETAVHPWHSRPGGGSWGYVGENINGGYSTCDRSMNAFINSKGHNETMLDELFEINYTAVFAEKNKYTNEYTYHYVQAFDYDAWS